MGVYAEFGSASDGAKPPDIPARPFIGLDDGDRDAFREIALDAIEHRASG